MTDLPESPLPATPAPTEPPSVSSAAPALGSGSAYARAGVDIAAGQRAVDLMKGAVARTHTAAGLGGAVLSGLGGFGGLFRPDFAGMAEPVLVASTDGVGTKTKVSAAAGAYASLGHDIVNHCANDILVQGARPLFFLDYIAMGRLLPEAVAEFVGGAAAACEQLGAALLGGETAEMPGVYLPGELDIVGTVVGVVDRSRLVTGERLEAGDVAVALPSSGLHTNGYSLARKLLEGLDWTEPRDDLGGTLQDALTVPHRAYGPAHAALERAGLDVRGMAHITGGGLIDNLPRIFPAGLGMQVDRASWAVPPLFALLVERGNLSEHDAFHALNMGVGFVFLLPAAQARRALDALEAAGERPWLLGRMVPGAGVTFTAPGAESA